MFVTREISGCMLVGCLLTLLAVKASPNICRSKPSTKPFAPFFVGCHHLHHTHTMHEREQAPAMEHCIISHHAPSMFKPPHMHETTLAFKHCENHVRTNRQDVASTKHPALPPLSCMETIPLLDPTMHHLRLPRPIPCILYVNHAYAIRRNPRFRVPLQELTSIITSTTWSCIR